MNTLDIAAAAAFLGLHPDTLRERAAAGIIPGAKIGREWRFLRDDLTAYFRSRYPCPSTGDPSLPSGTSTSAILAADALDALLAPPTGRLPSDSTTSLRLVSGTSSRPAASSPMPSSRGARRGRAARATSGHSD